MPIHLYWTSCTILFLVLVGDCDVCSANLIKKTRKEKRVKIVFPALIKKEKAECLASNEKHVVVVERIFYLQKSHGNTLWCPQFVLNLDHVTPCVIHLYVLMIGPHRRKPTYGRDLLWKRLWHAFVVERIFQS
jgi:hypothetical protein